MLTSQLESAAVRVRAAGDTCMDADANTDADT